jgi:hypothetical protein
MLGCDSVKKFKAKMQGKTNDKRSSSVLGWVMCLEFFVVVVVLMIGCLMRLFE